jgi:phosphinothricin acetyltransferase
VSGLRLRFATRDDTDAIASIYAPVVERTAISFEIVPPTPEEFAARLDETMPDYPWLVAEGDTRVVGYAYGHRFAPRAAYAWSVETSIYVRDGERGRGVGYALYDALLVLLGAQGYRQAFAGIALPNPASVALHESVGFMPVGAYRDVGYKFGAWHDVGWWQRSLDAGLAETPTTPTTPLRVDALERELVARVLYG